MRTNFYPVKDHRGIWGVLYIECPTVEVQQQTLAKLERAKLTGRAFLPDIYIGGEHTFIMINPDGSRVLDMHVFPTLHVSCYPEDVPLILACIET